MKKFFVLFLLCGCIDNYAIECDFSVKDDVLKYIQECRDINPNTFEMCNGIVTQQFPDNCRTVPGARGFLTFKDTDK